MNVWNIYQTNVYELKETLFDDLDALIIPTKKSKGCSRLAVFDFESVFAWEETYEIETAKLIGEHVPIATSISSNTILGPILLQNFDLLFLVSSGYFAPSNFFRAAC